MFRLFFLVSYAASAATLTLTPAVMFDCTQGFGTTNVTWSGAAGPVQVVVGAPPAGIAFTALTGPSGQASTGPWVSDGLTFYLVDQSGAVQASATAHVNCAGTPRTWLAATCVGARHQFSSMTVALSTLCAVAESANVASTLSPPTPRTTSREVTAVAPTRASASVTTSCA